jgi:hypothetical protein
MRSQVGFTLLEVLVASVIFIASIAVISVAYRGNLIASERANLHIQLSGVTDPIISVVSEQLRQMDDGSTALHGQGQNWGVDFAWYAKLLEFKSAIDQIDLESANVNSYEPRFRLWLVNLEISKDGVSKQYSYKELSWLDEKS